MSQSPPQSSPSESDSLHCDDDEAFRQWLEAVRPAAMMVRIESRMSSALCRRMAAEDLWQETQLHAWRDRAGKTWASRAEFRAWLIQIAENRIRDASDGLRTQKRDLAREVPLHAEESGDSRLFDAVDPLTSSGSPSRLAAQAELARLMREALGALPEIFREVLRLRLFEEWDRERIAAHLGLSLAAVKHRIRLGAMQYRERLAALNSSRAQVGESRKE